MYKNLLASRFVTFTLLLQLEGLTGTEQDCGGGGGVVTLPKRRTPKI